MMLPKDSVVSHGGIAVADQSAPAKSGVLPGQSTAASLGCQILPAWLRLFSNSANDNGVVVGTAATHTFSAPAGYRHVGKMRFRTAAATGETLGDANSVNLSALLSGRSTAGSLQRGAIYSGGSATIITKPPPAGSFFVHWGISQSTTQAGSWAQGSIR